MIIANCNIFAAVELDLASCLCPILLPPPPCCLSHPFCLPPHPFFHPPIPYHCPPPLSEYCVLLSLQSILKTTMVCCSTGSRLRRFPWLANCVACLMIIFTNINHRRKYASALARSSTHNISERSPKFPKKRNSRQFQAVPDQLCKGKEVRE